MTEGESKKQLDRMLVNVRFLKENGFLRMKDVQPGEPEPEVSAVSTRAMKLFDRLYTQPDGPIAELVTAASRRIAEGEDVETVTVEVYPEIVRLLEAYMVLEKELVDRLASDPEMRDLLGPPSSD